MTQLTHGEQNRLIQDHVDLVAPIAAEYRGRKGIPFEDLQAQGMLGLVEAARTWLPTAKFSTFATYRIRGSIKNFIDSWQDFVSLESDEALEDRVHEWAVWGTIPAEGWNELPADPEQVLGIFEEISGNEAAISSALISLTRRERQMVEAHFLRKPAVRLEQIARDHKLSYYRAIEIVYGAVKKMRDVVHRMKENKSGPPSRMGRSNIPLRAVSFSSANIVPFRKREGRPN